MKKPDKDADAEAKAVTDFLVAWATGITDALGDSILALEEAAQLTVSTHPSAALLFAQQAQRAREKLAEIHS